MVQNKKAKQVNKQGVPVLVNPVTMKNTMSDDKLGLDLKIGPDDVTVAKKKSTQPVMA